MLRFPILVHGTKKQLSVSLMRLVVLRDIARLLMAPCDGKLVINIYHLKTILGHDNRLKAQKVCFSKARIARSSSVKTLQNILYVCNISAGDGFLD